MFLCVEKKAENQSEAPCVGGVGGERVSGREREEKPKNYVCRLYDDGVADINSHFFTN